jgi:hypothetical protein
MRGQEIWWRRPTRWKDCRPASDASRVSGVRSPGRTRLCAPPARAPAPRWPGFLPRERFGEGGPVGLAALPAPRPPPKRRHEDDRAAGDTSRTIRARSTPLTSGMTTSISTSSTWLCAMLSTSSASAAPLASNTRYPASASRRKARRRTTAASSTTRTDREPRALELASLVSHSRLATGPIFVPAPHSGCDPDHLPSAACWAILATEVPRLPRLLSALALEDVTGREIRVAADGLLRSAFEHAGKPPAAVSAGARSARSALSAGPGGRGPRSNGPGEWQVVEGRRWLLNRRLDGRSVPLVQRSMSPSWSAAGRRHAPWRRCSAGAMRQRRRGTGWVRLRSLPGARGEICRHRLCCRWDPGRLSLS